MNHAIIAKYIVEVEELIRKLEQEFPDSIHYFTTPCFLHALFTRTLNRLKLEMLPAEAREALNKIAFLHKTPPQMAGCSAHT